ncbi:MAG TPA: ABC transporter ATP-binding protein [bacterium]|jgi:ABC-type lipoprotein export system ATPase subunit|nr:ABC transporter ATP-binding protein [bacterium]
MGISALGIGKTVGNPPVRILSGVNLDIARGDFVSLTGRSGSGKSTLLHILGTLDRASEGMLWLDGSEVGSLVRRDLDAFRNRKLGFVFQFHYLLAELSALENVLLPAHKAGAKARCRPRAEELLRRFGLGHGLHRLPRQLSGGEQQRVAIARALVMEPEYLLADEPTGALDSASGTAVMEILRDCHARLGTTIILATHDPDFAALAPKRVHMVDGSLR